MDELEIRMRCMEIAAQKTHTSDITNLGNALADAVMRLDRNEIREPPKRDIVSASQNRQYDAEGFGETEAVTPQYPSSSNGFLKPGDEVLRDWDSIAFGRVVARCDGAVMVRPFGGFTDQLWHVSRLRMARTDEEKKKEMPF